MKSTSKLINIAVRCLVSYFIEKASVQQYTISIKIFLANFLSNFWSAELSHVTGLTFAFPNELILLLKTSTVILVDGSVWLFVNNVNAFFIKKIIVDILYNNTRS